MIFCSFHPGSKNEITFDILSSFNFYAKMA
jgi:hypothetical protein